MLSFALAGCSSQRPRRPRAASPKPRIQEGLPEDLMDRVQRREVEITKSTPNWSMAEIESVILVSTLWNPGDTITVGFKGGTNDLRRKIADTATEWQTVANIHLDFGYSQADGTYREWTTSDSDYRASVRISFDSTPEGGYWSALGKQSVDRSIWGPKKASMNFEGFDRALPEDWRSTVIHEFGHVLGFEHEHQGPFSTCEQEYRWSDDPGYVPTTDGNAGAFIPDDGGRRPGIYRVLGGPPNYWTTRRIDFNLKKLPYSGDLSSSPFDKLSIMKYHFDEWMYKNVTVSTQSGCYSPENVNLSEADKKAALDRYPYQQSDEKKLFNARLALITKVLAQGKLSPELKTLFQATRTTLHRKRATLTNVGSAAQEK